jgi:aryl-alcohol dehydrogenase-like predicted oxidoreductase
MQASRLVFGTGGRFGRLSPVLAQHLVDFAISSGISYFDTGYFYSGKRSQRLLFSSLSTHLCNSSVPLHISTKLPPTLDTELFSKWVGETISNLHGRDYIDTLFIWGPDLSFIDNYEFCSYLECLISSGRIKSLGVNTHDLRVMEKLPNSFLGNLSQSVMIDFNLLQQDRLTVIKRFYDSQIRVWAGTSLCQGFLLQSLLELFYRTRSFSYLARALLNPSTRQLRAMASLARPYLQHYFPDHVNSIPLSYVLSTPGVSHIPIGMLSRNSISANLSIESSPTIPSILQKASSGISELLNSSARYPSFKRDSFLP